MAYSNFYANFYIICRKIGQSFLALWRFRPSRLYLLFIFLFQVAAWLQAWSIRRDLTGNLVVLHYNVNFGTDLIGAPHEVFYYPLLGLGVLLINLVIALAHRRRRDWYFFIHVLFGSAAVFNLILCLVLLSIYLINFR